MSRGSGLSTDDASIVHFKLINAICRVWSVKNFCQSRIANQRLDLHSHKYLYIHVQHNNDNVAYHISHTYLKTNISMNLLRRSSRIFSQKDQWPCAATSRSITFRTVCVSYIYINSHRFSSSAGVCSGPNGCPDPHTIQSEGEPLHSADKQVICYQSS